MYFSSPWTVVRRLHHAHQLTFDSGAEITPCTSAHLRQWCGDYTMHISSPSTVVRRLHHAHQLTFDSGAEISMLKHYVA